MSSLICLSLVVVLSVGASLLNLDMQGEEDETDSYTTENINQEFKDIDSVETGNSTYIIETENIESGKADPNSDPYSEATINRESDKDHIEATQEKESEQDETDPYTDETQKPQLEQTYSEYDLKTKETIKLESGETFTEETQKTDLEQTDSDPYTETTNPMESEVVSLVPIIE